MAHLAMANVPICAGSSRDAGVCGHVWHVFRRWNRNNTHGGEFRGQHRQSCAAAPRGTCVAAQPIASGRVPRRTQSQAVVCVVEYLIHPVWVLLSKRVLIWVRDFAYCALRVTDSHWAVFLSV